MIEKLPERPLPPLEIIPLDNPEALVGPPQIDSRSITDKADFFRTHAGDTQAAQEQLGLIHQRGVRWGQQSLGVDLSRRPVTPQPRAKGVSWREVAQEETATLMRALSSAVILAHNLEPSGWHGWFTESRPAGANTSLRASIDQVTPILGLPIVKYKGGDPTAETANPPTTEASAADLKEFQEAFDQALGGVSGTVAPQPKNEDRERANNMGAFFARSREIIPPEATVAALTKESRPRVDATSEQLRALQTKVDMYQGFVDDITANRDPRLTEEQYKEYLTNATATLRAAQQRLQEAADLGIEVEEQRDPEVPDDVLERVVGRLRKL